MVRGSGIILHISSLPGSYGVGDLGRAAVDFVDFLSEAGQSYWQFLPLGPVSAISAYSPYMSSSALAGNYLFVDPDDLAGKGLVSRLELDNAPGFSEYQVDFAGASSLKEDILARACREFMASGPSEEYLRFCAREHWLDDHALFMALREEHQLLPWHQWPEEIASRRVDAIDQWHEKLAERVDYHRFVQFCFFSQWQRLKEYANSKGVSLIGDIPFYVAHDSVDVWADPSCFRLAHQSMEPTHVAGVPPDYFSATGQRWGNPLYRWQDSDGTDNEQLYSWWITRLRAMFKVADICRIDHFRGFEAFWEIAAAEETAVNGKWVKGPGRDFFTRIEEVLGELPIIAEDLGVITPAVTALRRELGFPGMKILQFAFDSDQNNPYLPHNYRSENSVVYTGTHDNDTSLGWFMGDQVSDATRQRIRRYLNSDARMISRELIRLALASVAGIALVPIQDLLGFGSDCRMNTPGTVEGNWQWRCAPRFLDSETASWLRGETEFYNRLP